MTWTEVQRTFAKEIIRYLELRISGESPCVQEFGRGLPPLCRGFLQDELERIAATLSVVYSAR